MSNDHAGYGNPTIKGTVLDNARVNHDAYVGPAATIKENAYICDDAFIREEAIVKGNAEIRESATIKGNAIIDGDARIGGHIVVGDNARIGGKASLHGEGYFGGFAEITSDNDYVIIQGLTSTPLTIYKSSAWGIEVATVLQGETPLECFLENDSIPQSLRDIVGLIAKKWQK